MPHHKLFRNIIADVLNEETRYEPKTRDGFIRSGSRYHVSTAEFQHVALYFILRGPLPNCIVIAECGPARDQEHCCSLDQTE